MFIFPGDCVDPKCSGHGVCEPNTGTCLCDIGWRGVSCDNRNPALHQCLPDCSAHGDYSVELGKCQCHHNWTGRECNISKFWNQLFSCLIILGGRCKYSPPIFLMNWTVHFYETVFKSMIYYGSNKTLHCPLSISFFDVTSLVAYGIKLCCQVSTCWTHCPQEECRPCLFYAKGKYWAHVQKAQANKLFECREFEGLKLEMPKTSLHISCSLKVYLMSNTVTCNAYFGVTTFRNITAEHISQCWVYFSSHSLAFCFIYLYCQVFPKKLAFPCHLLGQSQENAENVV